MFHQTQYLEIFDVIFVANKLSLLQIHSNQESLGLE